VSGPFSELNCNWFISRLIGCTFTYEQAFRIYKALIPCIDPSTVPKREGVEWATARLELGDGE
jgi:hypothetical protein